MARLSSEAGASRLRARRWDAVVLGASLAGLVAATRLAIAKKSVLLVEEEDAARWPLSLREPFLIPGGPDTVVDRCIRELGLPLIDRRRLVPETIGLQVLLAKARVDLGAADLCASELVAWGLAKPEEAASWAGQLGDASRRELDEILETPLVRTQRGRAFAVGRRRGVADAAPVDPVSKELRAFAELLRRGLTLPETLYGDKPAEVSARAIGAVFSEIACFQSEAETLSGLMRQRFQALHGEIRLLPGRFSLVNVDGAAAIRPAGSSELWVGKALIINAPAGLLREWLDEGGEGEATDFLPRAEQSVRRVVLRFQVPRDQIPEGMGRRVLDESLGHEADPNLVWIAWNPGRSGASAEIIASVLCAADAPSSERKRLETALEARVRALLPFAEERLERNDLPPTPRWDNDFIYESQSESWPDEIAIRLVSRPAVYRIPREAAAPLGQEADCLLGWRAGETILGELG